MRRLTFAVTIWALSALVAVACGTENESVFDPNGDGGGSSGDPGIIGNAEGGPGSPQGEPISLEPADPVVTFTVGQAAPSVTFTAKTASGVKVPATFAIDRGELGAVGSGSGLFTASGKVGGKATISGTWNGCTASTSVTVKLVVTQNGPGPGDDAGGGGAGGFGSVGGEGLGGAVDTATSDALKKPPVVDTGLVWLYPYDKTVWPRGILAPLLQWKPGAQADYDAVSIKITEAAFTYEGTFARPNAPGATPFRRHPIPQGAWRQMLQSNPV